MANSTQQQEQTVKSVLKSGQRVQDVKLLKMIGYGGQAEVWKASELSPPHREIAVKLVPIPFEGRSEPENVTKVRNLQECELGNWAQIREAHNVVPLYGPVEDRVPGETEYVVIGVKMPLAEGDLSQELQGHNHLLRLRGRKEIRQFLIGIARGLKALHDVNISHGDIKPENILLFSEGQEVIPKLMDFGLSLSGAPSMKQGRGTPEYMAPELFETGGSISLDALKSADVYSLGILFYYIYFGNLPFEAEWANPKERFEKYGKLHKEQPPLLKRTPKIVDPELRELISQMLQKSSPRIELHAVITRLEAGLITHLTADGQIKLEDVIRPDRYRWNPEVHGVLGNNLHYHLIKAVNPMSDIDWLRNNLRDEGIHGYSIHRVLGGFDYLVRLWLKTSYENRVERIMDRFVDGKGGKNLHLRIRRFELFQKSPKIRITDKDTILSEIAQCADSTDENAEFLALKKNKFVLSELRHRRTPKIRFFVFVSSPTLCPDKVFDLCLGQLRTELLGGKGHPEQVSVYYGSGEVRGLLKFRLGRFHDYIPIVDLLQNYAMETRASADLNFQSFVEFDQTALVESDDGSIPREVALHCAEIQYGAKID